MNSLLLDVARVRSISQHLVLNSEFLVFAGFSFAVRPDFVGGRDGGRAIFMCADLYLLDGGVTGLLLNYLSTSCRFRGIALLGCYFFPAFSADCFAPGAGGLSC